MKPYPEEKVLGGVALVAALVLGLFLLLPLRCTAQRLTPAPSTSRSWSAPQRLAAVATTSAILLDCATTQVGLARGHAETNPLLGRHPTPLRLWATCAVATGGTLALAHLLPKQRGLVLGSVYVVEMLMFAWNLTVLK